MPLTNVVGGADGVTFPPSWENQANLSFALESYSVGTSYALNQPTINGYMAWTDPVKDAISSFTYGASNTNYLTRFFATANGTTTKADVNVTTAGTVTSVLGGIYSSAGVLLASAPSISGTWTTGKQTFTWTTPLTLVANQIYYFVLIITQSVAPVLTGMTASPVQNFNLTAATADFASNGTSATLPASYTMASNVLLATSKPWVAIY